MNEKRILKCAKCDIELVDRQVMFSYMRRSFGHNVPVCPKCGKATRLAHKVLADGTKKRLCKKCGETF